MSFGVAANAMNKKPSPHANPNAKAQLIAKQPQHSAQLAAATTGSPRKPLAANSKSPNLKVHPNTGLNAQFIDFSYVPYPYGNVFGSPVSVATDSSGDIYIADEASESVYEEIPQAGGGFQQILLVYGFASVSAIAVDYQGNLYAADGDTGYIWFYPSGTQDAVIESGTLIDSYDCPASIAVDSNLNVFVADACEALIGEEEFNGVGNSYTYQNIDGSSFYEPIAVAVDSFDNLYVADFQWYEFLSDLPDYTILYSINNTGTNAWSGTPYQISDNYWYATGIAVSPNGTLYVTDQGSGGENIPYPAIYTEVPTQQGGYNQFQLSYNPNLYDSPYGAALDPLGNFYFADDDYDIVVEMSQNVGSVQVGNYNGTNNNVTANFVVTGTGTLGFPLVYTQGEWDEDYQDDYDNCDGATVSGTYFCSVTVDFGPQVPGVRTGGISIYDDSGDWLASSPAVFGTGVAPRASYIPSGFENTSALSFIINPETLAKPGSGSAPKSMNTHMKQPKTAKSQYKGLELGADLFTYPGEETDGIVIDPAGNYYVSDPYTCNIWYSYDSGNDWYPLPIEGFLPICPSGGLAVDGSGNVIFTAYFESYENAIIAVDYNEGDGDYTIPLPVEFETVTGDDFLWYAQNVTVDAYDNVYFTGSDDSFDDSYAYMVPADAWVNVNLIEFPEPFTVSRINNQTCNCAFDWLTGIATDNYGDIFISDYYMGQVFEEQPQSNGTYSQTELVSSLDTPSALNMDAAGDLYILDSGDDTGISVLYMAYPNYLYDGPTPGYNLVPYFVSNYYEGDGLYFWNFTTDSNDSFYLTDAGYEGLAYIIQMDVNDPPTIYFDETSIGQTSSDSPEVEYYVNTGNDYVNDLQLLPATGSGLNPSISYNFLYNDDFYGYFPGGQVQVSNCPQLSSGSPVYYINPDASCALPVSFIPHSAGTDDGTLVITSNTLYGSPEAPLAKKGLVKSKVNARSQAKPHRSLAVGSHGKLLKGVHPLGIGSVAQTVNLNGVGDQVTPTITLLSSSNPAYISSSITFTVTIAGLGVEPTGTVNLMYNSGVIGSGTLNSSGQTQINISTLPLGTDSITAVYLGDSNYLTVTSTPLSEVVQQATPNVQLTSSANPALAGSTITFSVAASGPTLTPTGTINLYYNAVLLGTGTLSNGSVSFNINALPVGTDPIHATYSGDTNYLSGTSNTVSQVINPSTATITLLSSSNPSFNLNPVTFSVAVTGLGAVPTGSVNLIYNAAVIGTGTLTNGQTSITVSSLPIGTDGVTAVYSGDGNYQTATSGVLSESIVDFSISITSPSGSTPPVVKSGGSLVVDFTVAPVAPATGDPTPITFSAAGGPLSTSYTFSPASIPAGSGSTPVTLTINIPLSFVVKNDTLPTPGQQKGTKLPVVPLALALLLLPIAGRLRKAGNRLSRMAAMFLLAILGVTATATLIGCGANAAVPADIVITASSGNLSHTGSVTITLEGK